MVPQVSADSSGIIDFPRRLGNKGLFFAFGGGVGKFGTNFTVFYQNGITLWIDAGAGFSNHNTPGLEKNLPNRQLLLGFPPTAIFLTHGHEDHIGALPHLTKVIPQGTPIYASPFTSALVQNRLRDRGIDPKIWNFNLVEQNSQIEISPFRVFTFFMPHSIPQCFSVGLETKLDGVTKRIYFSSDFKLKGGEVRHKVQQIKKFAPIDYLFVDSTGSLNEGETADEKEVDESLEKLILKTKGRIFLTTFASQVERIKNCARIAARAGRPVGFLGRSLKAQWQAGFEAKEVDTPLHLLRQSAPNNPKALWLVAGCQADDNSSFSRLTRGMLPKMRLKSGDTLIYSASMIPGNEGRIYECLNRAAAEGVNVIGLTGDVRVHASGHGRRGDIQKLIGYLRPKTIVPVHGDALHLHAFLNFVKDIKIKISLSEGNAIYSLGSDIEFIEKVADETCLVEPGEIHFEENLYRERLRIGKDGICIVLFDAEHFQIKKLTYVGVMSASNYQNTEKELFIKAAKLAADLSGKNSTTRETSFRNQLGRVHQSLLGREPYIKIIRSAP